MPAPKKPAPPQKKAAAKRAAKPAAAKSAVKPAAAKPAANRAAKPASAKPAAAKPAVKRAAKPAAGKPAAAKPVAKPRLLSGGNPQIAKADGDPAVQAYLAAMPGWKRAVGRRLDALITAALPGVRKAVKWNTPFYGLDPPDSPNGAPIWFLGFHCATRYIKVAFFQGTALQPMPPVESKQKDVRYLHIYEGGEFDEGRFVDWVRQAGRLQGEGN